jgi:hypothetical protein
LAAMLVCALSTDAAAATSISFTEQPRQLLFFGQPELFWTNSATSSTAICALMSTRPNPPSALLGFIGTWVWPRPPRPRSSRAARSSAALAYVKLRRFEFFFFDFRDGACFPGNAGEWEGQPWG